MSIKVAVTTSLIVGLSASVAHAQESAKANEELPTPEQGKAAGATGPTNVNMDVPECPPVQQVSAPMPQPIMPVSAPEPAPIGPAPVAFRDEEITSYLQLAPKNAFEVGFQGGYFQPFGDLMKDVRISNITDAGGEVALDLGWRVGPMGAVAVTGRYNESVVDDQFADSADMDIRGGAVGLQGTVYLAPYMAANPYLTMGAAYRTLWLVPQNGVDSTIYHGVELARVQLGLDFRVARDFSIGPNAGAAVNMFVAEDGPTGNRLNPSGDTVIDDPRPSAMVFAGLAGRFQVGGSRVSEGVYYGRYPQTRELTASRF